VSECSYRLTAAPPRRRGSCLCVEAAAPVPRCMLKAKDIPQDHALRWLGSGGDIFVFGPCTENACPSESNDVAEGDTMTKTYYPPPSKRYRVRVALPPHPNHRGFVVWADSEEEARERVRGKGHVVQSVKEEPIEL